MRQAVLILILGVPLFLVSAMAPSFLQSVEDERAWRGRRDAVEYLEAWPGGWRRPEAIAEVEAEQRKHGFVSQLRVASGPAPVHSADFTADGAEAVTADGIQVSRWSLDTGALLAQYGGRKRNRAEEPTKYGFGFLSAGLLDGGRRIVALTNGPHSLQTFGEPAAPPLVLPGDGYEGLTTQGSLAALVHSVQDRDEAVLVNMADRRTTALPHPEVTMVRFAPNGDLLTVSRREGRWWRNGRLERTAPMPGMAEPLGISADARLVLVPDGQAVIAWNIDRGKEVGRVRVAGEPVSACSCGDSVYVGAQTGEVMAQSVTSGQVTATFRAHVTAVNRLFCGPEHLISAANNGGDTRLWRVNKAASGAVATTPAARVPGWMVEQGLRFHSPGVAEFVREYEETFQLGGLLGIGAVGLLAYWTARRRPSS